MISAAAGVMGSDNSNGSAHKHLAQFTLSNAPHGPTPQQLSVCLLTQLTGAPRLIKYIDLLCAPNLLLASFSDLYLHNKTFGTSLICNQTPLVHFSHFLPDAHTRFPFIPQSFSVSYWLILSHHLIFLFIITSMMSYFFTWPLVHTPVPLSSLFHHTSVPPRGLNRWPVAG